MTESITLLLPSEEVNVCNFDAAGSTAKTPQRPGKTAPCGLDVSADGKSAFAIAQRQSTNTFVQSTGFMTPRIVRSVHCLVASDSTRLAMIIVKDMRRHTWQEVLR